MATWGKHGLHPVAKRPKTATEKLKDHLADGGEEYASGARGKTPAILGMQKADKDNPFAMDEEFEPWTEEGTPNLKGFVLAMIRQIPNHQKKIKDLTPLTDWRNVLETGVVDSEEEAKDFAKDTLEQVEWHQHALGVAQNAEKTQQREAVKQEAEDKAMMELYEEGFRWRTPTAEQWEADPRNADLIEQGYPVPREIPPEEWNPETQEWGNPDHMTAWKHHQKKRDDFTDDEWNDHTKQVSWLIAGAHMSDDEPNPLAAAQQQHFIDSFDPYGYVGDDFHEDHPYRGATPSKPAHERLADRVTQMKESGELTESAFRISSAARHRWIDPKHISPPENMTSTGQGKLWSKEEEGTMDNLANLHAFRERVREQALNPPPVEPKQLEFPQIEDPLHDYWMDKARDPETGIYHPDAVVPPQGSTSSTFHPHASGFVRAVHNAFGSTTRQQDIDNAKGVLEEGYEYEQSGRDPIHYEGGYEVEEELAKRGVTGLGAQEIVAAWGKRNNMSQHILSQPDNPDGSNHFTYIGDDGDSFIWDTIAESYGGNSITEPYVFALEGADKYVVDIDEGSDPTGSYERQLDAEIDAVHQELKGHSHMIGRSKSPFISPMPRRTKPTLDPLTATMGQLLDPVKTMDEGLGVTEARRRPDLKMPPEDPDIQNMQKANIQKAEETRKRLEGMMDKALLWPSQPKENGKGRKVKTRVGDSPGGYPT